MLFLIYIYLTNGKAENSDTAIYTKCSCTDLILILNTILLLDDMQTLMKVMLIMMFMNYAKENY